MYARVVLDQRQRFYSLGLSAMTKSRLCKREATKRKIEHMPNITVIGKASTFKHNS